MDPEKSYERMVEPVGKYYDHGPLNDDDAIELIECIDSLDSWLKRGGFPPAAWRTQKGQQ